MEFVLLGTPTIFLFIGLIGLFFNSYVDAIGRMATLEASRYAALADVSISDANEFFANRVKQLIRNVKVTTSVEQFGTAAVLATMSYQPTTNLLAISASPIQIRVVTTREIPK